MTPAVLYHKTDRGRVALLSLNRPEVLNAYDVAMRDALFAALTAVRDDPEVRVVLLRGEGPAFSTGGDLKEFGTAPSPTAARETRWRRDVWGTLLGLPQVTVAAVHGLAVGGGFEMAMLCDLCWASDDARFWLPETGLAMIPGVGGTQTLARRIGQGRAMDLVLTGRAIEARDALRLGLVNAVVARARLESFALARARRLARLDPAVVRALKSVLDAGMDSDLAAGLAAERRAATRVGSEFREGERVNTCNFVGIPAEIFPQQEILVFEDRRWTYGALWEAVRRAAAGLRRLGVGPGDRVAALETNSDRYVIAYFASAAVGAVFVPLNYRAKPPELEYMIDNARTKLLLVGDRYLRTVEELRPRLESVQSYVAFGTAAPGVLPFSELEGLLPEDFAVSDVEEDDTTILMYTSGTTARPKGVMLTHGDFTAYVCGSVEMADGEERGAALLAAPLYHIAGATNVMTTLFGGRRLVVLAQFDAAAWLEGVERERVTHAFVVPTMMKHLIDHPRFAAVDLGSLTSLSYGGAAMPLPVIRRAIELFPRTVGFVNAFGQTETTSTLTVLGPEDHRLDGDTADVERNLRRLTSIGKPLPDVQLKVVDEAGDELPCGTVGEIWVATPRMMKGYAAEEGTISSPARDGWLPTRDMGWIDADGHVYLAGRRDDMIIRGGENISPAEIESVLYSHDGVEEVAVIGVPDLEWGQRVAAVVVARPGMALAAGELAEFCRARLASFKKPEVFHFVDELPKNSMGKVLKKDLRERLVE